jgi:hypothetical protein
MSADRSRHTAGGGHGCSLVRPWSRLAAWLERKTIASDPTRKRSPRRRRLGRGFRALRLLPKAQRGIHEDVLPRPGQGPPRDSQISAHPRLVIGRGLSAHSLPMRGRQTGRWLHGSDTRAFIHTEYVETADPRRTSQPLSSTDAAARDVLRPALRSPTSGRLPREPGPPPHARRTRCELGLSIFLDRQWLRRTARDVWASRARVKPPNTHSWKRLRP